MTGTAKGETRTVKNSLKVSLDQHPKLSVKSQVANKSCVAPASPRQSPNAT